jgi:hypothetical protein
MAQYRKFIVAAAAFLGVLAAAAADGEFSSQEIAAILVAAFGAFGVFGVANQPPE